MSMKLCDADIGNLRTTIRAIAFDIDDTFSSEGKLTSRAYECLWRAHECGLILVPITGRPAGWCDHIARFWPVDAVVGENGAFCMRKKGAEPLRVQYLEDPATRAKNAAALQGLRNGLEEKFPGVCWASDQDFRWFDLAIDFCEDVSPPWAESEISRLLAYCEGAGAHAKRSSIHVNTWFGQYDKASGFEMARAYFPELSLGQWLYLGDSPNDEPMFRHFEHSIGVANIAPYLDSLQHPPTWVTERPSGEGFAEAITTLLGS